MKNKSPFNEKILIILILFISGLTHGLNMFHFPYYENDEGTYMSQAWSLVTQGKLAPYTYWYDHAPAGWFFLAVTTLLVGGFFAFGTVVNTGRVIMLFIHLINTYLIYSIGKRLTKRELASIVATIIFSLSPLAIYFQRRVLLDNIMTFWVLVSLYLLITSSFTLKKVLLSGLTFGIAVLTKENAIFFIPAFIYLILTQAKPFHIRFALIKWLAVSSAVISLYFLYAILKSELFPNLNSATPHVSLIATLNEQLSRGSGLPFWHHESDFYLNLISWFNKDKVTVFLGMIIAIMGLVLAPFNRTIRTPALFMIIFCFFLLRGGLILDFYIIPLVPFLALTTGTILDFAVNKISAFNKNSYLPLTGLVITSFLGIYLQLPRYYSYKDETTPQVETINWIKQNLNSEDHIVIDDSIFVDLHAPRFPGDKIFPNADWAWKVELDPEITDKKLDRDWTKISYMAVSYEILKQIHDQKFSFLKNAFDNSSLVVGWKNHSSNTYINLNQYISTNGDWMSIHQIKSTPQIITSTTWKHYVKNYIRSYGQVFNPDQGTTTSSNQAQAMLYAVWMDDQPTFDGVWQWTQDHLQYRTEDRLLSKLWLDDGEKYALADAENFTPADQNAAMALILAYKKWGKESYLIDAKEIMVDLWEENVIKTDKNILSMLPNVSEKFKPLSNVFNSSLFAPASYRLFSRYDSTHPWIQLINDGYDNLKDNDPPSHQTMWQVALDAYWFEDKNATEIINKYKTILEGQWLDKNRFASVYTNSDLHWTPYQGLDRTSGALAILIVTQSPIKNDVFQEIYKKSFNFQTGIWKNEVSFEEQSWSWLAAFMYSNQLPKLQQDPNYYSTNF